MQHDPTSIPLAAMIDMVFLLLVFFMCISHMSTAPYRIEIDLPTTVDSGQPPAEQPAIQLIIDPQQHLYLDGIAVTADELPSLLNSLRSDPLPAVHLRADRSLPWLITSEVIQQVAAAGYHQLFILSHEADS